LAPGGQLQRQQPGRARLVRLAGPCLLAQRPLEPPDRRLALAELLRQLPEAQDDPRPLLAVGARRLVVDRRRPLVQLPRPRQRAGAGGEVAEALERLGEALVADLAALGDLDRAREVPGRLVEPTRPRLGAAEADQREEQIAVLGP